MAHPIRRALIAVYDKTGIVDFARALVDEFGIEIISTGGTAKHLKDAGIPVTLVEEVTGFPELLDGRVKTLHPKIHAGILADRDNPEHMRQLEQHGIKPIDMVVVNLYPFEKTVADPNCTFEQAIEMIDIGGPCMLRAAAKNHKHVHILRDSIRYAGCLHYLRNKDQCEVEAFKQSMAECAWETYWSVSQYDAAVARWIASRPELGKYRMPLLPLHLEYGGIDLRYGENPHQHANYWESDPHEDSKSFFVDARMGFAPAASFNNLVDADAALGLCAELARAALALPLWHRFSTGECGTGFQPVQRPRVSGEQWTERNLPHLQFSGSTYFVTFRLKHGVFSELERDIVLEACRHWHGTKMTLHAAVVMPDHVHLLLTPHEAETNQWISLSEIMHSIKRHSAREINRNRGVEGALWLDEYFDRLMRDEKEFIEKWEYMEANPVAAGIAKPGEYKWFWKSQSGFMETLSATSDMHGLQTRATTHRLETGATIPSLGPQANELGVAVFIKHTNACGIGASDHPFEAYRRAYLGDPNAAMGGILAVSFPVTSDFATLVIDTYDRFGKAAGAGGFFLEVWLAPSFEDSAIQIIRSKKKWGENVRLLGVGDMSQPPDPDAPAYRTIAGGMLVQTPDLLGLNEGQWKVVTKRGPTQGEMDDLRLAWLIAKHTKSNAISICKNGMLIGNGAGQMSRVMSCRIATWLAKENKHEDKLRGSAAASDAFFPFRDGPDILMDAGVTAIIQPGGSKRDEDTIRACDERGVAMIFTGTRHFKH